MSTSTIAAAAPSAAPIRPEHRERIHDAIRSSRSENTIRAYRQAWTAFARWTEAEGLRSLPASPETVAAYLSHLGETRKIATVRLANASIAAAHREHENSVPPVPNPCSTELVKRTVAGVARAQVAGGKRRQQATAITGEGLASIVATIRANGNGTSSPAARRRAIRDTALLSLMRDAMIRRSEAAAIRWSDLSTESDGSGRLLVRRSKTDQEGEGAMLYIGRSTMVHLAAHRNGAPDDASVFGLSDGQIHRIIRKRAEEAGIERAGGHSLRVGTAQDLAAAGAELPAIMVAGRWSDPKMVARYTAATEAGRGAVARFIHGKR